MNLTGAILNRNAMMATDQYISLSVPDKGRITILGVPEVESVCTFINDCVFFHRMYGEDELDRIERGEADVPLLPGFSHNARTLQFGAKMFVVSSRDIAKDEEIFYSYGR